MALTVSPDLRQYEYIDTEIDSIEWAQFRGLLASPDRDNISKILCFYDQKKTMDTVQYMSQFNVEDDKNQQ